MRIFSMCLSLAAIGSLASGRICNPESLLTTTLSSSSTTTGTTSTETVTDTTSHTTSTEVSTSTTSTITTDTTTSSTSAESTTSTSSTASSTASLPTPVPASFRINAAGASNTNVNGLILIVREGTSELAFNPSATDWSVQPFDLESFTRALRVDGYYVARVIASGSLQLARANELVSGLEKVICDSNLVDGALSCASESDSSQSQFYITSGSENDITLTLKQPGTPPTGYSAAYLAVGDRVRTFSLTGSRPGHPANDLALKTRADIDPVYLNPQYDDFIPTPFYLDPSTKYLMTRNLDVVYGGGPNQGNIFTTFPTSTSGKFYARISCADVTDNSFLQCSVVGSTPISNFLSPTNDVQTVNIVLKIGDTPQDPAMNLLVSNLQ